jgi:hypothetical protein
MDINNLYNINCRNEDELDEIKLEELKHISQDYGLDQHGTKITLCKNIQSYLKAIQTTTSQNLDKNNIVMIHNIYDFIRVLNIDDLKEIHTLSDEDIDFLWTTIQNELSNLDINADLDKIKQLYPLANDIDLKVVILIDILSRMFCDCIKSKSKYGKKKVSICKKTVLNRHNVNVSNFVCDKNNTVLLSKFGDREILQKYTQK